MNNLAIDLEAQSGLPCDTVTVGEAFARSLVTLMKAKDLSGAALARGIDITEGMVSKMKAGKRAPSFSMLEDIRSFMGVPPYFLLKPDASVSDTASQECADTPLVVSPIRQLGPASTSSLGVTMSGSGYPDEDLLRIFLAYWAGLPAEAHQRLVDDAHQLKMRTMGVQARLGNE